MPPDDVAHITPTAQDSCRSCWLAVPGLLWMILFFLVPLLLVLAISFASRGTYGGIVWEFTWANYLDLLHPLYGKILVQSLCYATVTTAICFLLGFPCLCDRAQSGPLATGVAAPGHAAVLDQLSRADLCLDDPVAP